VRQFDVVENPDPETRRYSPFLVVLQSHHLDPIETIFLAPLVNDAARPVSPVDIPLEFNGHRLVMAIGEAAGVPRERPRPCVGIGERTRGRDPQSFRTPARRLLGAPRHREVGEVF